MKIVRHTARDMRAALRAVREQLGEDAVILSSKRTPEGVEVTAAAEMDEGAISTSVAAPAAATTPAVAPSRLPVTLSSPASAIAPSQAPTAALSREPTPTDEPEYISQAAREAVVEHVRAVTAPTLAAAPEAPAAEPPTFAPTDIPVFRAPPATGSAAPDALIGEAVASVTAPLGPADEMGNELKSLRRMLETQLAQLAWNDLTRRAPVQSEILRELTEIGITPDLAEHLVRQLPADTDLTFGRRFVIAGLSQYLLVTGDRWLDAGARVAFAGATGVGKTTTLAKVAVRWVLRHGPRDIALVAADCVRIGAQEQLRSLGQLLGVPVYTPERFESLPSFIAGLEQRLVLIDTPGSSLRDTQLESRLAVLAASPLETTLILAANTQAGAQEEVMRRFATARPSCCLLTKLDEAVSLGGALSNLIRAKLPVAYVCEGQRAPEDLRPARALELVSAAIRLAKASGAAADEDLLRRRFGKSAHAFT